MEKGEIDSKMKGIFEELFGKAEAEKINGETQAKDVRGWDSMAHMELLTKIEETFSIKFNYREIASFDHVKDIYATIEKKVK